MAFSQKTASTTSTATQSPMVDEEPLVFGTSNQAQIDEITKRRGTRPKIYNGFFNDSNTAERLFRDALPRAVAWVNKVIAKQGFEGLDVTSVEVATTFISEGGLFALDDDRIDGLAAFSELGLDTIGAASGTLPEFLGPSLTQHVKANKQRTTNEKGETVTSARNLSLEQGVLGVAAQYAWCKVQCAKDLASKGQDMGKLSRADQMYWTTLYFNAGCGAGRKILDKHGVGLMRKPWRDSDPKREDLLDPTYNAAWRTASFEHLDQVVGPTFQEMDPAKATAESVLTTRNDMKSEIYARAVACIRKYDAELHGRRLASPATWESILMAFDALKVFGDAYADNDFWRDYKRRAARFADFETAYLVWLHQSKLRSLQIDRAYEISGRDIDSLFRISDPIALRKEAGALEDAYGWIDRLFTEPVDVESVVKRLRAFADGDWIL